DELGRQRFALQVFHHQVGDSLVVTNVVQSADVRMIQSSHGVSFAVEPFAKLRIGGEGRGQNFDRDRAIEAGIASFVNLAHSAGASERDDLVGAKASAGLQGHRCHGLYLSVSDTRGNSPATRFRIRDDKSPRGSNRRRPRDYGWGND